MKKIINFIKKNKMGLIVGAVVGYLMGRFVFPMYMEYSVIANTNSILDPLKSAGTTLLDFAKTKVIIVSTLFGAFVGGLIDSRVNQEKWLRRLFK